jgi:imidazoleglycerol-phosphate dehydratase
MHGRWKRAPTRDTTIRDNHFAMSRNATIDRKTAETDVHVELAMQGTGSGTRETGVGFLDHMLDLLAHHARLDLTVKARGDLKTGGHHTVEDVGICIGQALDRALADRSGIVRYGEATVPMDEARAACAIDVSGRGLCVFEGLLPAGAIGDFEHELAEEFFRALSTNAKLTLHLSIERGTNAHHMIEAAFKAAARALRVATALDPSQNGVPSTKGSLA